AEPTRKMTIAVWSVPFRPYRSPNFPYSGPVTVDASRYAVTTHERCWSPPRSPTIVGSAVDTIVWSSDASRMTSISAPKTTRTRWRCSPEVTPNSYHWSHEPNREDGRRMAERVDTRGIPGAAGERNRAGLHRRVRPRVRAGHLPLRRLRCAPVRVRCEIRLRLRVAGLLRAGRRGGGRGGERPQLRHGPHGGALRELRRT